MEQEVTHKFQIKNFNRLIEHDESNQFQIVIKIPKDGSNNTNKFEINTTLNRARILSKKINDTYLIDPTINKFEFKYCKKNNQVNELLQKMISSLDKEISITPDEVQDYTLLMILLGEENDHIKLNRNSIINTIEEAISLLSAEFHANSIYYLASHFKEFLSSFVSDQISTEIILEIIDAFFEYSDLKDDEISSVYEELTTKDESASIVIHFLTRIDVAKLTTNMIDYIYDHLNDDILNSEILRITSIVREHYFEVLNNKKQQAAIIKKVGFEGNELDGIFSFLKKQDGGELKENTLVLSGGGNISENHPLTNLLKYDSNHINSYYDNYTNGNAEKGDSWIKFDFCKQKVKLTSYTIRSDAWGYGSAHPMSWRFVGSNDGENWEEIDKRKENSDIKGNYLQHRFVCNCGNDNFYRFIKFIQDDNWCMFPLSYYNVNLTCIEFFGSISTSY